MSAWLLDKCIAYAKAHRHPELTEQTIWECQLAWSSYSDRDWQPVRYTRVIRARDSLRHRNRVPFSTYPAFELAQMCSVPIKCPH
jgi:hypothetical protein